MLHEVKDGDVIAVWFSCGAASAVAARLTLERYPNAVVRILNNPVAEEHLDNRRFLEDVSQWLGHPIEEVKHPNYPEASAVSVWDRRNYMVGLHGAPCTVHLKKEARQHWERSNRADWHVLGFTSEERDRYERFIQTERSNVLPLLIDAGLTKQDCLDFLLTEEIAPPLMYELGYPNANCIGCVKATSPTYWNHVRKVHPEVFKQRAEQSRRLGARLVRHRNKRIFLDELPPDARGRALKSLSFECGIFCEERH